MRQYLMVLTRKGQITIPVEIRRALGLTEGDRMALVMEDDQVRITRTGSAVARTAGLLKSTDAPLSAEDLREKAEEAIASSAIERGEG